MTDVLLVRVYGCKRVGYPLLADDSTRETVPWQGAHVGALSSEDYESVLRAGRELHARGWRKAFTLNEMLDAYEALVVEVEQGYDQMVDEYTNDLACRDWLALAWPMLTERVQHLRQAELEALDERFRAASIDDGGQALRRYFRVDNKSGWWWRRRPIKVVGDFAAALSERN